MPLNRIGHKKLTRDCVEKMTPSGSTRHHALAIKTNDGRESDFDFLAEPPGYQRHLIPFKWVFRIAIFVVLISLLVLVVRIVVLRQWQDETHCRRLWTSGKRRKISRMRPIR